jgi:predicted RNase H-like HicB family nuclease
MLNGSGLVKTVPARKNGEYSVSFERADDNWAAYSPDVPGCVATGKTREEVERNFSDALGFQFEGLVEDNLPIPEPSAEAGRVRVSVG